MRIRERIRGGASKLRLALTPSTAAWKGAALGVYAIGLAAVGALFVIGFLFDFAWQKLPAVFVWVSVTILIGLTCPGCLDHHQRYRIRFGALAAARYGRS